ncbi:HAD-superfamily hydrolase [Radiomyces spectabilis]|uniref:HAD-superfamily hydrolase n=1 Tax=Radiomyces spectabilis TaxID=64574 RepID=UPI0022202FA9|nr:HAD-superfamily hydrolase [Radiomyces spectabilis]KAI8384966.1 HAD-superfamily hydrolase [Radiomyces spectabilis]
MLHLNTFRSFLLRRNAGAMRKAQFHSGMHPDDERLFKYLCTKYDEKKAQHMTRAQRDQASILSMDDRKPEFPKLSLHHELKEPDAIFGLGITSPDEVFINNELHLSNVEVYGFDYDYTLANYTDKLSHTIYDILKDIMVDMLRYPKEIKEFQFDPSFAIRGLHYDYNKGWLMKIDNMANVQLNTVHVGREPISKMEEVFELHNGLHISPDYLNNNMFQLNDLFSIPQTCLLSDILQYFREQQMSFHPRYLSDDLNQAARILHTGSSLGTHGIGGRLHMAVMNDIDAYLEKAPNLVGFLEKLRKNGKKTFLLTNSTLPFISKGMTYMTSREDWRDLFDCVIVSARKPEFYRSRRPFRRTREPTWSTVDKFEPGEVYQGGNMTDFSLLTGWSGQKVLYFGDHIFSDLIDPTIQQGWHTGAIIHELAQEIETRNTSTYRHTLSWLLRLERLLNEAQGAREVQRFSQLDELIEQWRDERRRVRLELKTVFNRSFGSVFRTYQNPSFFANKIRKFADIYMANVTNLEHIPLDYVFYPNRTYLPHERLVETLIDTGKLKEYLQQ